MQAGDRVRILEPFGKAFSDEYRVLSVGEDGVTHRIAIPGAGEDGGDFDVSFLEKVGDAAVYVEKDAAEAAARVEVSADLKPSDVEGLSGEKAVALADRMIAQWTEFKIQNGGK